jgi:F-type H+-transporting ATPase subunit b
LTIYASEIIWTVICFVVLLFVLKKLLFDPLLTFMEKRDGKIARGKKAGDDARAKRAENDAAILEGRKANNAEAAAILAEGRTRDEQARAAALQTARQEAAQSMKDTRAALRSEETAAAEALKQDVPELANVLAGALLHREQE